jgi:hypothetical protein
LDSGSLKVKVFRLSQRQKMQAQAWMVLAILEVMKTRATIVVAIVYGRLFGTPESFRMRYVKDVLLKVTCDQRIKCAKVQ